MTAGAHPSDPADSNPELASDSGPIGPEVHRALGLAPNSDSIDELDEIHPATRAALHAEGLRQLTRIAAGSCGVVCRGTDLATSNFRAVKILLEPHSPDALRMFQRECRILDAPELPPGLVPRFYRAVEPPEGQPFMILEWIDGETLGNYLAARPALTVPDRELLCLNLCRAYAQLHAAHILQRDPSLNNILVGPRGQMRLIDFSGGGRPHPGYRSLQTLPAVPVTHAFASDAVRSGERRPTAADEVHAVARICFTVLSGKLAAQHPPAELHQLLASARIPADFSSVILEYTRQPPPEATTAEHTPEYWNAATLAARLDSVLLARSTRFQQLQQRRSRHALLTWKLTTSVALCLFAVVLFRFNNEAAARQQLLREQTESIEADLNALRLRLSPPLPVLSQRLEDLRQRHTQLTADFQSASVAELQQRCSSLLADLLQLHQDHAAALRCENELRHWKSLYSATPPHILETADFTPIRALADQAADSSRSARWDSAARSFAAASNRLKELLRNNGETQLVTPLNNQPPVELVFRDASLDPREVAQIQQALADSLNTSVTTRNSIGMNLNLIPAGEFLQGSPITEPGRKAAFATIDPEKQRVVRIRHPFRMGATEVTQAQWQTVMQDQPWQGQLNVSTGPDYPAAWSTWATQVEFTRRLSALENQTYRLPTEAEWEYACRAGALSAYSFGDDPTVLNDFAWTKHNSAGRAHPVRQKLPNPLGLYDMHGNLLENCLDRFAEYSAGPLSDPRSDSGEGRVNRGGSFRNDPLNNTFRSAYRTHDPENTSNESLGFRVILELPVPQDP